MSGRGPFDRAKAVPAHPFPAYVAGEFMHFLMNNNLPNGRTSPFPAFPRDEFTLHFQQPYRDWAPAPFNNTNDSAYDRVTFSLTGMKDMDELDSAFTTRRDLLSYLDHEIYFDQMRAWGGLIPLSERHWKEKGLSEPDKLLPPAKLMKAIDHLDKAIPGFTYSNIPATLSNIRRIYNTIYDHLADFDRILTAYYTQQSPWLQPDEASRAKLTDLWAEFFFSHVEYITNRAQSWHLQHAETLFNGILDELKTEAVSSEGEQHVALEMLNRIIDHQCYADYMILLPLTGFKNELPHWQHLASPPVMNWNTYLANGALSLNLCRTFPQDIFQRAGVHFNRCAHLVARELDAKGLRFIKEGIPSFLFTRRLSETTKQKYTIEDGATEQSTEELAAAWQIGWEAMKEARRELRCEPLEIREEIWITRVRSALERPTTGPLRVFTTWGFVAYRLSYSQSDGSWAEFLDNFKNDVTNWGEGVMGADHIKSKCKIKWIDGRDVGISEGDIDAARRHFKSLRDTHPAFMSGLLTTGHNHFLVADRDCIESYLHRPELPGQEFVDAADLKSFVVIAQTEFDAGKELRSEGWLGYGGWVYVAGSVLFHDVWPSLIGPLYDLKQFWRVAAAHPGGVYIGPYGDYQKALWAAFNQVRVELLEDLAGDVGMVSLG